MFMNIVLGLLVMVVDMGILVLAVALLIHYLDKRIESKGHGSTLSSDAIALAAMMGILMMGQAFMFTTWALLFVWLGEFDDFATAFYHSAVNFTSLGYGDIVMSEQRRLLGALEAANGVMMLGLTTGAILSVMNVMFGRLRRLSDKNREYRDRH